MGASGTGTGNHGNFQPNPFIEEWNGSAWSLDPSPDVTAFGYLDTVSCVRSDGCIAVGFAATNFNGNFTLRTLAEQLSLPAAAIRGSCWPGLTVPSPPSEPPPPTDRWAGPISTPPSWPWLPPPTVAATGWWPGDGGIFSFGDATFDGSMGGSHLNAPIVGMAATRRWRLLAGGQ